MKKVCLAACPQVPLHVAALGVVGLLLAVPCPGHQSNGLSVESGKYRVSLTRLEETASGGKRIHFEVTRKSGETSPFVLENLTQSVQNLHLFGDKLAVFGSVDSSISGGVTIVDLEGLQVLDFLLCYHPEPSSTGRYIVYRKFYPRFAPSEVRSDLVLVYDLARSPQENRLGSDPIPGEFRPDRPEHFGSSEKVGFPIYPLSNSQEQSYRIWVETAEERHHVMGRFLWDWRDEWVLFIDTEGETKESSWVVVVDISEGLENPKVAKLTLDDASFQGITPRTGSSVLAGPDQREGEPKESHSSPTLVSSFQAAEEIQYVRSSGDGVIYHDVDMDGRVLEIDYAASSAHVIGELDLEATSSRMLHLGWLTANGKMLLVFVEPIKEHGVWGRFHLFDPASGTLRKSSLVADVTGEFAITILDRELAYIQYFSRRQGEAERFVLDMARNRVVSDFDFDLRYESLFAVSNDDPALGYLVESQQFPLRTIDLVAHRIVEARIPEDLRTAHDRHAVFVVALEPPHLLATYKGVNRETQELRLLETASLDLVARSGPLPSFSGKYLIETDEQGVEILCVENRVEQGRFVEVGRVRRFRVPAEGTLMEELQGLTYDPESEVVLRTREGTYDTFPRYSFDYVSLLEAGRTVMVQFPNGLPDGMSLREAYEILEGDMAKPGSLPARKLRIEPLQEKP